MIEAIINILANALFGTWGFSLVYHGLIKDNFGSLFVGAILLVLVFTDITHHKTNS